MWGDFYFINYKISPLKKIRISNFEKFDLNFDIYDNF